MVTNRSLSVIIAAYNAAGTIGEQLESLARQRWSEPWEVLVVNNRSTDATVKVADSFRRVLPQLRVIDAPHKQSTAYALNLGVHAAAAARIAICDADDVVGDGWVAAMGDGLARYAFVSAALEIELLNTTPLTRYRPNAQGTGIQKFTYPPFLPHAGAGTLGFSREVFEMAGGFDESLAALFDTDFCWKLQLRGIPLTPLPSAVVHLRRRGRVGSMLRQAKTYAEYDVALYKRYRPLGMPKLSMKSGISGWLGLLRGIGALRDERRRAEYLWMLGWRTGRLYGSIKHRVWAL